MKKIAMTPRRWWHYVRLGHSSYLSFALQASNFILIAYTFFVSRVLEVNPVVFIALFIGTYYPMAAFLGKLHIERQFKVENAATYENNPLAAKITLTMLRAMDGSADKAEIDEAKKYLSEIAKKA